MHRAFPRKLVRLIPVLCLLGAGISVTVVTVALRVHAAVGNSGTLSVFVGYAEDKEVNNPNPANFPVPWAGAPDTIFLGNPVPGQSACGTLSTCYDTGAIRLDNSGTAAILVDNVTVNIHGDMAGGKIFNLWGAFTVPAGQSVILAANPPNNNPGSDNFDTSGYPPDQCTPIAEPPTVAITIGGVTTTLVDSAHVLDTDGIDLGYCHSNESIQWHAIGVGAVGVHSATLSLYPANTNPAIGQKITETAFLEDATGYPLPNAQVNFSVASGPDAGLTGSGSTDATGHTWFTYTNTGAGVDTVVASVPTVGAFQTQTNVFWGPQAPPTWTGQDIGNPPLAGSQSLNNGIWTVRGEGTGISGAADQFHFLSEPLLNDGSVSAQVLSETNTNSRALAGVMLRLSSDPGSPFYLAAVTPQRGIVVTDRALQGNNVNTLATIATGTTPVYLQVMRTGSIYTAYTSSDGVNWMVIAGSSASIPTLTGTLMGGLAVTSLTATTPKLNTATFSALTLQLSWAGQDIGSPSLSGSDSMNSGVWTLSGSGTDIGGTADQFHFVSQSLPGDGGIRSRVLSQRNTNSRAKAGVMLRLDTTAGSPFYSILVMPQRGITVLDRTTEGAGVNTLATITTGTTPPVYLQVMRSGNTYTAYTSSDGVNWTAVAGSSVSIPTLTGALMGGLAVSSHNVLLLNTAVFDEVSIP